MNCLVTGAAGFIGSTLAEQLLSEGHSVRCIDSFEDYYSKEIKLLNSAYLRDGGQAQWVDDNLATCNLDALLDGIDTVFHLAATPGVRASWGDGFIPYVRNNIQVTERLLFKCKDLSIKRFVYSSSSSVYGNSQDLPLRETSLPQPFSPYGVTKLAAEHLCQTYWRNYDVPVVSLRYFTVYGPRQRPDMAFHKFIKSAVLDKPVPLYGDGTQTRDFTFVKDAVRANILAAETPGAEGAILNVGGGSRVTVLQTLDVIRNVLGRTVKIDQQPQAKGDVRDTQADTSKITEVLGFKPTAPIEEGIAAEIKWMQDILNSPYGEVYRNI